MGSGSTWVGFSDIWWMLVNVGEYLMKKVHRYESKFGLIGSFLSVDLDDLSGDFEK